MSAIRTETVRIRTTFSLALTTTFLATVRTLSNQVEGEYEEGLSSEFLGSKQPEPPAAHERLKKSALGPLDITAATMANIGPAMSFYFGFLAFSIGLASPLVIIVAGIAIAFLGNTLSEFTKVLPSTGGFISFVGKTFCAGTAVTTALMTGAGYIAAMSSVIAISGGYFLYALQYYNVGGLLSACRSIGWRSPVGPRPTTGSRGPLSPTSWSRRSTWSFS